MFPPLSLEFYLNYKVSIEIQGLSSTDCNFQGLSRRLSRFVQTLILYHMQETIDFVNGKFATLFDSKQKKLIQIFQTISLLKETMRIELVINWHTHLHKN